MDRLDWKRIFRFNMLALKVTGLWPPGDGSYGRNLYTLYAVVSILLCHVAFIATQTINLYFIKDDLSAVTGTIFILLTDMGASLKTYALIKNMRILKHLMVTVNCDLFQPKGHKQKNLILPSVRFWQIIVSLFWFFTVGCLILWSSYPIVDKSFLDYRLPFLAWHPYDIKTSPQYELTYLYQVVSVTVLAVVDVSIDNLIAYLNMYVGVQFDILRDDIRNLGFDKSDSDDMNRKLIKCVHYHKAILKFAAYVNQFYNRLLLVQFCVSGISIGLAMFQLTIVAPFSSEFYSFVSYANAISVQVFLYCWFGNEIEVKVSKIFLQFYLFTWLQRSLQISAFGLFFLSVETFVKVHTIFF
ncbi:7tm 6 domain containing protein [Asbolus verrucosus]|uniref:Odorant receptor n=1 Tax=Asbolus verrucosus TaxID=1661398 RepID=A0A482VSE2_ASBVE|nr:7tm 6 domain containing protein [Asbolus verrucosus]